MNLMFALSSSCDSYSRESYAVRAGTGGDEAGIWAGDLVLFASSFLLAWSVRSMAVAWLILLASGAYQCQSA